MGEHARSVGVNNFKSLWASYKRSMKGAAAGDDTFINVTEFSGQPVELISGQWIANDTGVYWINRMSGEKERICPHAIMRWSAWSTLTQAKNG